MSKHRDNAEAALDRVQQFGVDESADWSLVNATCAVAEATLALVEQQLAANLLAMARIHLNPETGDPIEVSNDSSIELAGRLMGCDDDLDEIIAENLAARERMGIK